MALKSTQPLTEMSTRNLPGGKEGPALKANSLPPFVSRFSRKCGNLDVSQPYGPPRPVTGVALHFTFSLLYSLYELCSLTDIDKAGYPVILLCKRYHQ
jgi:hypothetical protein